MVLRRGVVGSGHGDENESEGGEEEDLGDEIDGRGRIGG